MKKLILLLVLLPFVSFAKFYKGTVTMNDGALKTGFIELPEYPDDATLKFRTEEKGNTEKLDIELVKGFEITNDKKEVIHYLTIFLAKPKSFTHNQFIFDSKKSWVKIIKEGKIAIYFAYTAFNGATRTEANSSYYVKKPNEDYAYFFSDSSSGGFSVDTNGTTYIKKTIGTIFRKDCPKLANLIVKEDLKKNGYAQIVYLYEQNCGK